MPSNKRILLVENNPNHLRTRSLMLRNEGYDVCEANSVEKARELFFSRHVHMAVIDIRLVDDNDHLDQSGLELARDPLFSPIPKIILTSFTEAESVMMAYDPDPSLGKPAAAFVKKEDGPEEFVRRLADTFAKVVNVNWDLEFVFNREKSLSFTQLVLQLEPNVDAALIAERSNELESIIRRLFPNTEQVTINRILTAFDGQMTLEIFSYGDNGNSGQRVLALGKRDAAADADQRYDKYAPQDGRIGNTIRSSSSASDRVESINYGASLYHLVGIGSPSKNVRTFKRYYRSRQPAEIVKALSILYQTTLKHWDSERRALEFDVPLAEICANWLFPESGFAPDKIRERVAGICKEAIATGVMTIRERGKELEFKLSGGNRINLPNPADTLFSSELPTPSEVIVSPIHGRVTADTTMVGPDGQTWVLDFSNAGNGPLICEFVTMEQAIRFDLMAATSVNARVMMEQKLLEVASLTETPINNNWPPQIVKAAAAIAEVRQQANDAIGGDLEQYLTALLFCAIGYLLDYEPGIRHHEHDMIRHAHCLYLVSILLKRLAKEKVKPAGPAINNIPSFTLQDNDTRLVSVDGNEYHLAAMEYELVKLLFIHANKPVRRETIWKALYNTDYLPRIHGDTLSGLARRVRKRIDPEGALIETIFGVGYKLKKAEEESGLEANG